MQRKIEKARRSEEKRNDETKEVGKGEQVFPLSFSFSYLRKKGSVKYSGREDSRVLRGVLYINGCGPCSRFEELVGRGDDRDRRGGEPRVAR